MEDGYRTRFQSRLKQTPFNIELPASWKDFFVITGEIPSFPNDRRNNRRIRARAHGLMFFEQSPPFLNRPTLDVSDSAVGIYTRDFSCAGIGLVSPIQLFPEERVRLVLPTFWLQMRIIRARRLNPLCYDIGGTLIRRHGATPNAFEPEQP